MRSCRSLRRATDDEVGVTYLNPPSSTPPAGMYSHVARMAPGELAFIAGQVAVDRSGASVGVGDLAAQVNQVFANIGDILKDLGSGLRPGGAAHHLPDQRRQHPRLHVGARERCSPSSTPPANTRPTRCSSSTAW